MLQLIGCKHIGHKSVALMMRKNAVIIYGNAAGLLPPVLQGIKRKIG